MIEDRAVTCRGCPHEPHIGSCTKRSGGTAYACGCHLVTLDEANEAAIRRPLTDAEIEALERDAHNVSRVPTLIRSALYELRRMRPVWLAAFALADCEDEFYEEIRAARAVIDAVEKVRSPWPTAGR